MDAKRAHPQEEDVLRHGCRALVAVCQGTDAAARARSKRASDAGALEEVVQAMRAHPEAAEVQANGCSALLSVCGSGASAAARSQAACGTGRRTDGRCHRHAGAPGRQ